MLVKFNVSLGNPGFEMREKVEEPHEDPESSLRTENENLAFHSLVH